MKTDIIIFMVIGNSMKYITRLLIEGNCDSAINFALNEYKKTKDVCFLDKIAKIYFSVKNIKEAINYYKKIYVLQPDNLSNIKILAYSYFLLLDYKKALKYYKIALDYESDNSTNYFNVASMYHYLGKKKKAFDYYNNAILKNPNNLSAINNIGLLCYENKYYEKAIPYFKRAIKTDASHPEAYHHLGVIYREYFKDLKMSKYYIQKALYLDPNYILNSYQLALTYKEMGNLEKAQEFLKRCQKIDPEHKDSKKELEKIIKNKK